MRVSDCSKRSYLIGINAKVIVAWNLHYMTTTRTNGDKVKPTRCTTVKELLDVLSKLDGDLPLYVYSDINANIPLQHPMVELYGMGVKADAFVTLEQDGDWK